MRVLWVEEKKWWLYVRVADPDTDPNWIRIQLGQRIRIRIPLRIRIQEGKITHKSKI